MTRTKKSPLEKLATLAPKEKPATHSPKQGRKRASRGFQGGKLSRLYVDRYLGHYGIEYTSKQKGGVTIYRLAQCVFDPGHTRNEAAINQDDQGLITYKCFHNSCQGKHWADARQIISGDNKLAQFCEGYDPDWTPPRGRGRPPKKKGTQEAMTGPPGDDKEFLIVNPENGRGRFIPGRMANYLEEHLKPIVFEGKRLTPCGSTWPMGC